MKPLQDIAPYLMIIAPLLIIEVPLMIFCIIKILKEGVANLNKMAWIAIVVLGNLFGSIAFLIAGRKKEGPLND